MVESAKTPTPEELQERIVRLEGELAALQGKLDAIDSRFQKDVASISDHLIYLYQRLEDYLWPVVHKVFPGFGATLAQSRAVWKKPSSEKGQ
jgi:uncharacterized coiled-coil protein SlyX